ncbi:exosortase A [Roseateles paludis]|uniref:Exosortase A n=1 Tax=Roseateles paludis TaxID=3145238 RepID=A0ABV0G025_9BURK
MRLEPAWRWPLLALAAAWACLFGLYWGTAVSIVAIWERSDTFAHAYVVPPIAAWLVWTKRAQLATMKPRPDLRWLAALIPAGALWLVGSLVASNAATQFGFAFLLLASVPLILGSQVGNFLSFPLVFLLFAVPFGDFLTPLLMERTADFTVMALRATGVPVYREGLHFIIPSGAWSVIEACSGIRYLLASVMVGTLFGYLNYQSMKKRLLFMGVAVLTPLIANWLRAYMIVMIGHLSGNELATGVDHIVYGWVFFGLVMIVMFTIGMRWADPDPLPASGVAPGADLPSAAAAPLLAGVALAAGLMALPVAWLAKATQPMPAVPPLTAPALQGWTWQAEPLSDWRPGYRAPTAQLSGQFRRDGAEPVGFYVAYYRQQSQASKLVSSANGLAADGDKHWIPTGSVSRVDVMAGTAPIQVVRGELRAEALGELRARRLRAWQTFWADGGAYVDGWKVTALNALARLRGQHDDAAVLILYADKGVNGAEDEALQRFVAENWPALESWMRSMQAGGHP